jgi:hypothetical protein
MLLAFVMAPKSGLNYEGTLKVINNQEHVVGLEHGESLSALRTCSQTTD